VQLIVEKEILIVVASLVVHCCAIKKNVAVASQLYDVADVQFTVEKEGPLNFYSLFKSITLRTLFPSKYSNNAADFPQNCRQCCYQ